MKHSRELKLIFSTIIGVYIYFQFTTAITYAQQIIPVKNQFIMSSNNNAEMMPFYWMVTIVGGCIAVTLTYVSWRKYKGEKKKQSERDSNS
ncbi:sporulation protein YpjB [Virgibacillus litoralis]|uniref:Sporulation protein YpjB n=1 Tax=Virgibacillus litoralis TaxID=578221 RepID=A0ABS4HFE1_9BACI|nr:sporulation protein YpjB [Virgibacillus litoralis]